MYEYKFKWEKESGYEVHIENYNNYIDLKKQYLNYVKFIVKLIDDFMSEERLGVVLRVYENIKEYARSIRENVGISLMRKLYNIRRNIEGISASQSLNEFLDNFENFHYNIYIPVYLGNRLRTEEVSEKEFVEFYKLISFITEDDGFFVEMVENEWIRAEKGGERCGRSNNKIRNSEVQNDPEFRNGNLNDLADVKQTIPKTPKSQNIPASQNKQPKENQTEPLRPPLLRQEQTEPQCSPMEKLIKKLRLRSVRGVMNLHKQFLFSCSDLNKIEFDDFVKTMSLQRLSLLPTEYRQIFDEFSENGALNFPGFIRKFKKVLNEKRLQIVEEAFTSLDEKQADSVNLEDIKLKFNASGHPDVIKGCKNEEEVITEFLDCFELNYNLLTAQDNQEISNLVSFEEFANFYEYVSFLYEDDDEFISLILGTWNLQNKVK